MAETQGSHSAHVLPPYFEKIQRYLVLPLLLIGEFYVTGLLAARGFVARLDDPASWSWYGGVGVVVMFLGCGLAGAGIALGLSGRCAEAYAKGRPIYGTALLLGVLAFAGIEMYAGISERSVNLVNTPADTWVSTFLGMPAEAMTPASVIAAIMLTLDTVFYGFALKPPQIEAAEERRTRMQRELEEAEHKRRLAGLKGQGMGAMFGGMAAAAREQITGEKTDGLLGENQDDTRPDNAANITPISAGKRGRQAGNGRHKNTLTAAQLRQVLAEEMGTKISDSEALFFIRKQESARQLEGVRGNPWAANRAATIRAARAEFGGNSGPVEVAD